MPVFEGKPVNQRVFSGTPMQEEQDERALSGYPERNFFQRTVPVLGERLRRSGQAAARTESILPSLGKQSLPETAFQVGGEALMGAGDVLGNLAISGFRALPDVIEKPIRKGTAATMKTLGNLPAGFGAEGTLSENIPQEIGGLMQGFSELEEQSPRTAANLRSALAFGTAFTPVKPADALGKTMRGTGEAMKKTSGAIKRVIPPPGKVTLESLDTAMRRSYKLADDLGGSVKPQATKKIGDAIRKAVNESDETLEPAVRELRRKAVDPENKVRQILDVFHKQSGKPLTLKGFEVLDKDLTGMAFSNNVDNNVQRMLLNIRSKLRSSMDDLSPEDMVGGKSGYEAYKRGRDLAKKKFKLQDIEEIIAKSYDKAQPQNYIKKHLTKYVNDPDNIKYLTEAEKQAIKKAAEDGVISDITGMFSGRLLSTVMAGSGDMIGGGLLRAGSTGVRGIRGKVLDANIDDIARTIAGQSRAGFLGNVSQIPARSLEMGGSALQSLYGPRSGRLGTLGIANQQLQQ